MYTFTSALRLHKFYNIDGSIHYITSTGKQTEIIDEIEFELPYGILGKLSEGYAYRRLQKTFEHRKIATIKAL